MRCFLASLAPHVVMASEQPPAGPSTGNTTAPAQSDVSKVAPRPATPGIAPHSSRPSWSARFGSSRVYQTGSKAWAWRRAILFGLGTSYALIRWVDPYVEHDSDLWLTCESLRLEDTNKRNHKRASVIPCMTRRVKSDVTLSLDRADHCPFRRTCIGSCMMVESLKPNRLGQSEKRALQCCAMWQLQRHMLTVRARPSET
jgi:hypothetical protein